MFVRLGLEKICIIMVDNASSNDTTISSLTKRLNKRIKLFFDGELLHVFVYILNLIIKEVV